MGNLLSKFVFKDKKDDVVHSSAYGVAQNEGGIGAASTQSFAQRMEIERNRQNIKGYRDARVVNERGREAWRIRQEARQMGESKESGAISRVEGGMEGRVGGRTEGNNRVAPRIQPRFTRKK